MSIFKNEDLIYKKKNNRMNQRIYEEYDGCIKTGSDGTYLLLDSSWHRVDNMDLIEACKFLIPRVSNTRNISLVEYAANIYRLVHLTLGAFNSLEHTKDSLAHTITSLCKMCYVPEVQDAALGLAIQVFTKNMHLLDRGDIEYLVSKVTLDLNDLNRGRRYEDAYVTVHNVRISENTLKNKDYGDIKSSISLMHFCGLQKITCPDICINNTHLHDLINERL